MFANALRDSSLKESLSRIAFRDVLLACETKGRAGARQFHPLSGMTREIAALEIIRFYGQNRVATYESEPRNFQLQSVRQEEIDDSDLLLCSPIHSVFGRPRSPVSFILDIDAHHESAEETRNWKKFEDRVLGLVLFACRKAFARNNLRPRKVCILTAGDGTKPYASLHLHVDFTDTAFVDSTSITNFIKGELSSEIQQIGGNNSNSNSTSSSSSIGKFAQRVVRAIDAQPFCSVGGSLRVYGAPKLDGSRPCRLYRPEFGGATSSALLAMAPTEGGPTIELMKEDQKFKKMQHQQQLGNNNNVSNAPSYFLNQVSLEKLISDINNNNNHNNDDVEAEAEGKSTTKSNDKSKKNEEDSIIQHFDVLNQDRIIQFEKMMKNRQQQQREESKSSFSSSTIPETRDILIGKHGIPVVRRVELEALAMSLGTPDWLSPTPFRFIAVPEPLCKTVSNSKISSSAVSAETINTTNENNNNDKKTDSSSTTTSNVVPSFKQPQHQHQEPNPKFPGMHLRLSLEGLPQTVLNDVEHTSKSAPFPFPREHCHPETFLHLSDRVTSMIPSCFAKPYKSWLSVALALSDVAVFTLKHSPESKADEVLEHAFLNFSSQAPNYDRDACVRLFRKMVRRKKYDKTIQAGGIKEARGAYKTLCNIFRKAAP